LDIMDRRSALRWLAVGFVVAVFGCSEPTAENADTDATATSADQTATVADAASVDAITGGWTTPTCNPPDDAVTNTSHAAKELPAPWDALRFGKLKTCKALACPDFKAEDWQAYYLAAKKTKCISDTPAYRCRKAVKNRGADWAAMIDGRIAVNNPDGTLGDGPKAGLKCLMERWPQPSMKIAVDTRRKSLRLDGVSAPVVLDGRSPQDALIADHGDWLGAVLGLTPDDEFDDVKAGHAGGPESSWVADFRGRRHRGVEVHQDRLEIRMVTGAPKCPPRYHLADVKSLVSMDVAAIDLNPCKRVDAHAADSAVAKACPDCTLRASEPPTKLQFWRDKEGVMRLVWVVVRDGPVACPGGKKFVTVIKTYRVNAFTGVIASVYGYAGDSCRGLGG